MQLVEQHVAAVRIGFVAVTGAILEQQVAFEVESGGDRAGLACMVGLGRALGKDAVGLAGDGHQEFQFARLVAAGRQAGAVVAFDPDVRPAEFLGQARQGFQRGGQVREVQAREAGQMHDGLRYRVPVRSRRVSRQ